MSTFGNFKYRDHDKEESSDSETKNLDDLDLLFPDQNFKHDILIHFENENQRQLEQISETQTQPLIPTNLNNPIFEPRLSTWGP